MSIQTIEPKIDLRTISDDSEYLLSVDQYLAMGRAGILTEDDRVELIEGRIVRKMTKRQPHSIASGSLQDLLNRLIPNDWYVGREEPVILIDTLPEPDVTVVKGSRHDYPEDPPRAADVALVVEVAESSLLNDRVDKKRAYARAGVVCYWLVDLVHSIVEVYTGPSGPTESPDYAKVERVEAEGTLIFHIEDQEIGRIAVREIFP